MNADIFAEWLRRQGHQVYKTESSYWYDQGPGVYQAFPYHWVIEPGEAELCEFQRARRAIGLRFSTPLSAAQGVVSYHAVFDGEAYNLDLLGKWARKNVRRGLRNCTVEPLAFADLAEGGWALQVDTLQRQGRKLALSRETWVRRCLAARDLPGFEAWGARVEHQLVASVITFQMEGCWYMLYQQCLKEYLPLHVNNALSYVVSEHLASQPNFSGILYGLHSLDAPASVDEFKFRMGYRAKPVRQRVVFHPMLRPFVNRGSHALVRALLRIRPGDPLLAKSEGMFRFYLHGMRPLETQPWPEPLRDERGIVLKSA